MDSKTISQWGGRSAFPWWLVWAAAAVFCCAAAVYFSGRERQYVDETARLSRQLESATAALTEWRQARTIMSAPGVIEVAFGTAQPNSVAGRIFVDPRQGVVLLASQLPPVPRGKVCEMWFIQPGQKPVAAGLFQRDDDGSAVHLERNAAAAIPGAIVAVTLENEGGAAQPASAPVFTVPIPARAGR